MDFAIVWRQRTADVFSHVVGPKDEQNFRSATSRVIGKQRRYSFSKSEILRGRKIFQTVLNGSKRVHADFIRGYYRIDKQIPPLQCMVGFAVKKPGTSVRRNMARRLMRESWRVHKNELQRICKDRNISLRIVFILDIQATQDRLNFCEVNHNIMTIISRLEEIITVL